MEELSLKQSIIEQIDAHAPPHVLVGSSSSYIPLSMVRLRAGRHPERIATVHPTLPQWDDFLEILASSAARTRTLQSLFGPDGVGMDVITMQGEMHGHVHNALLEVAVGGAVGLVKAGVATAADVDVALVHMARWWTRWIASALRW